MRLGTTPSAIKDLAARVAAYGQIASGMLAADEAVKGALAGYAFAQVEIAASTALVAAAQATGEAEIRACCERILQQERSMAAWLQRHLPTLTTAFFDRSAVDRIDAKRWRLTSGARFAAHGCVPQTCRRLVNKRPRPGVIRGENPQQPQRARFVELAR